MYPCILKQLKFIQYEHDNEPLQEIKDKDFKLKVARKVLEEPGSLFPIAQLNSRYGKDYISSSIVNSALEEMESKGPGIIKKVKVNKTKPVGVFYKKIPEWTRTESLRFYGVLETFYAQQFFLPLSRSLKVDIKLVSEHHRSAEINEKRKQNLETNSPRQQNNQSS